MRGAVCRWPFRAAADLLSRRGAGGNNKAALQERRRKSEAIRGIGELLRRLPERFPRVLSQTGL